MFIIPEQLGYKFSLKFPGQQLNRLFVLRIVWKKNAYSPVEFTAAEDKEFSLISTLGESKAREINHLFYCIF